MIPHVIVDRKEMMSAYMTVASVAASYKVETTKSIVEGWNMLRKRIQKTENLDFLATMLSIPYIFGTAELSTQTDKTLDTLFAQIDQMKDDLIKEGLKDVSDRDIAVAFLTNASVSHSKGMSSRRAIIKQYQDVRVNVPVMDNFDILAANLAVSRIMDVKKHPVPPEVIKETFDGMRQEIEKGLEPDLKEALGSGFGDNFLSTCTLTSAYIEISPKLEKYKDILTTWQSLKRFTESAKRSEIIAIILFAGKIRDIDSMHLLQMGTLDDQIKSIKDHIEMFDTR